MKYTVRQTSDYRTEGTDRQVKLVGLYGLLNFLKDMGECIVYKEKDDWVIEVYDDYRE